MIIFAGINGLVTKAKERKLIDLFQVLISNDIRSHFKVSSWRTRHSKSLFRVSSRMKIMRMTGKVELNQLPFYSQSKIYHISIDRTSKEWWHYEYADEKKCQWFVDNGREEQANSSVSWKIQSKESVAQDSTLKKYFRGQLVDNLL